MFRDGPSGRRAGLAAGPDVWEVVGALRESELRCDAAVAAVASEMSLTASTVRVALAYYGSHPQEIDAEIADNEHAAQVALRSWKAQRQLLA